MKKRIVHLLLALCLLLALFVGCGNVNGTESSAPEAEKTAAPAEPTPAAPEKETSGEPETDAPAAYFPLTEEKEVSMLLGFGPDMMSIMDIPNDIVFWQNVNEKLNVDVVLTCLSYSQVGQQVPVMFASGDLSDILFSSTIWKCGAASLDEGVDDGLWYDLTQYVEDYMPNYSAARMTNEKTQKASITTSGKIIGIFGFYEGGAVTEIGPFIRQDWLDNLDMKAPVTYDDYEEVLDAFYVEYAPSDTVYVSTDGTVNGSFLSAGFGVASDTALGELPFTVEADGVRYSPIEDGYKKYLSMIKSWYDKGYISRDFMGYGFNAGMVDAEKVMTDNCGLFITNVTNIGTFKASASNPDFVVTAVQSPRANADKVLHLGPKNSFVSTSSVISTTCEDVELACRFLDWFYSEEGYYLANYGQEGTSYTNNNGEIAFTDLIMNNPDGLAPQYAKTKYTWGLNGNYIINIRKYQELTVGLQYCEVWERDDNSFYYDKNLYIMDSETSADFMLAYSDVSTYVSETTVKFIIGELDLDADWEGFVSKVNELGAQTCIDAVQTSVDQYNAR